LLERDAAYFLLVFATFPFPCLAFHGRFFLFVSDTARFRS
jgi:hypothetical protein